MDAIRSRRVAGESVNTCGRGGDEEEAGEEAGPWGSGGARQGAFGAGNRQVSGRMQRQINFVDAVRAGGEKDSRASMTDPLYQLCSYAGNEDAGNISSRVP